MALTKTQHKVFREGVLKTGNNGLITKESYWNPYQDPTTLSFTLTFLNHEIYPKIGLYYSGVPNFGISPLFNGLAAEYLKDFCKDNNRWASLLAFNSRIAKVNIFTPWVFQSLSGLENTT